MGLSDDIVAALRKKYRAGATFAELAKSSGVSLTYLRSLTVGERDPMKMSLDFFLRLFPSAQIELEPAAAGIGSDSSVALSELDRRAAELDACERELAAERRELAAIRRELDAERRVLELEREVRPPAPPGVAFSRDPHAPYHISGAKSTSFSDKEK